MGLRNFPGSGCILADDMGLGKTLQSIAVMWTLLKQGTARGGPPVAKRCVVVCPTSLVSNWEAELDKWLKGACKCVALSETSRDQVISGINLYLSSPIYKVLIVSYETFRMHAARFGGAHANTSCDLLVCDEAHRLKNGDTATSKALAGLKCRRRVLLSGTPMQNDLEEFYAMVDFANPGALGDQTHFRRHFLSAITAAREPDATDGQRAKAQKVQNEMSTLVNEFILRRTNTLNAKHLPPKLVQVVACRLTDVQRRIYQHLLDSKEIRHILNGKQTNILSSIGSMQKLCNHPKLLEAGAAAAAGAKRGAGGPSMAEHLAEEVASMLPAESGRGRSVHPEWSGKMETLFRLMQGMRKSGDDRIVVVSNYTSALDLIGRMCQENHWPYCRLDGSTGGKKRKLMVAQFNDQKTDNFAFLLSSKAGGCGLNLIGGNRLVLFDPDWNPAVDKQAAARVWRDGQRKRCYVYRFISTGTIEEKIFQRQLSKEGLQSVVEDQAEVNSLSSKDLRNLFKLRDGTPCDTHDKLRCGRCDMVQQLQQLLADLRV
ncbi:SNF2 family N-terminal domain-containing protein [Tribonema minus]|uniref:SNF2 family N-terminal domain-containing protein n=1 Tax=Tribonema minus TaxID=303371 RepID=A0A836CHF7_9STRA|nr:SNF2 family N-terminal domain-containing protein [Tribonema minus]